MSTFKKQLKQEKNPEARRHLEAFYRDLVKQGKIKNYIMTEWQEDVPETQILQALGCDVAFKYEHMKYKLVDEKVCKNYDDKLYFELGKSGSKAYTGWAVSEYKKTDIFVYYLEGVGLFVLPFKQLGQWLKDNESRLEKHFSKDRKPNRNVRIHIKSELLQELPHSFVDIEELELMAKKLD